MFKSSAPNYEIYGNLREERKPKDFYPWLDLKKDIGGNMKINDEWYLSKYLTPTRNAMGYFASEKQFDSVTIWHDKDARPLVMTDKYVESLGNWTAKTFYMGICKALETIKDRKQRRCVYNMSFRQNHACRNKVPRVRWGCRQFTKKQLIEIKKAMEWHFGEKLK